MILFKTIETLEEALKKIRKKQQSIGFVPTMGALHDGHLSLIRKAGAENDLCLCSIFVNPTQFNNHKDFERYPISLESDIDMLFAAGADFVFIPSVAEMYPAQEKHIHYPLGYLEEILEGKYRPGHYQGVCRIIDKFLQLIQPKQMYLGQKDYQQCLVIEKMLTLKNSPVTLRICPTVREKSGLAMSSRNRRLTAKQMVPAQKISKALKNIRKQLKPGNLQAIKNEAYLFLEKNGFEVDYVSLAKAKNLKEVSDWDGKTALIALVAASIGEIRLIDNLVISENVYK